jgi:hypothetical protein
MAVSNRCRKLMVQRPEVDKAVVNKCRGIRGRRN